jgi:hypothetical protein
MTDLFGEMELAQGAGISGNIHAPGGVNLSGLPNVGGHGTPGMRSGRQRLAVNQLHKGAQDHSQPQQASDQRSAPTQQEYGQGHQQPFHPGIAMQQQGLASYQNAIDATNEAWQHEMDSRVSQAKDQADRDHEANIAWMALQSKQAEHQSQMAMMQQANQAREQRNSALLRAAGVSETKIVNGQNVSGFSPFRNALLG